MLTGVALLGDGIECREDILDLGTEELGRSSERVPILPQNALVIVDTRLFLLVVSPGGERASIQKVIDRPGHFNLTGVRSALVVNERIKGGLGSEKSLDTHRGQDLSEQCEMDGIIESQRCNRCGESCSV